MEHRAPRSPLRVTLLAALSLLVGCVGASPTTTMTACTPGRQVECACPGGGVGAQRCEADGSGYGECLCLPADAGIVTMIAPVVVRDAGADGDAGSDASFANAPDDVADAAAPDVEAAPVAAYHACVQSGPPCALGATCMLAQARASDAPAGSYCSAVCTPGQASSCPAYVFGQVECVSLQGDASPQCMHLCSIDLDCAPYDGRCVEVTTADATLRVCVP